jgi:hypothetical protein
MNEQRIDRIVDELTAAAGGIAHDTSVDCVDPEVLLDAIELIKGLIIEITNAEAIISNQRAELQRLRMHETNY